jgi:hypothetical protein
MQPTENNPQQKLPDVPPKAPEPEYPLFRWGVYVGVPIVLFIFFWLLKGIDASFSFKDLMDMLGVVHQQKYARLACLATLLVAVTFIMKTLKKHSD